MEMQFATIVQMRIYQQSKEWYLTSEYMVNRNGVYDRVGYRNLHVDLVEHVFNAHVNHVFDNWYDETNEDLDMFEDDLGEDYDDITDIDEWCCTILLCFDYVF